MRAKRRRNNAGAIDRRLLFTVIFLIALGFATVNCSDGTGFLIATTSSQEEEAVEAQDEDAPELAEDELEEPRAEQQDAEEDSEVLSDELFADALDVDDEPRPANDAPTDRISLDVRDADLLDVLSLVAYKLDGNIIFLEETRDITIKTSELSPITTLQTILQKEGLDYLTIGHNYIVGERDRLYDDFDNRMLLSRYNLFYVSAENMEQYITEDLDIPVEILTSDTNQQALWMQGTPMTLGKAREVINALDVIENAAFGEGGKRNIRMPVSIAVGERAQEELHSLIDLLSILLDGMRDDTDGWQLWDHPYPIPRIMDWDSPVIKPNDIKMKVTPDLDPDPQGRLHYLVAEGSPDNIDLIKMMIEEIAGTPASPFPFVNDTDDEEEEMEIDEDALLEYMEDGQSDSNNIPDPQGGDGAESQANIPEYKVNLNAVPDGGGSLSGAGTYNSGSRVTINATPSEEYEFVRWIEGGSEVSTSKSHTFSISGDRSFEAVFTRTESSDEATESDGDDTGAGEE